MKKGFLFTILVCAYEVLFSFNISSKTIETYIDSSKIYISFKDKNDVYKFNLFINENFIKSDVIYNDFLFINHKDDKLAKIYLLKFNNTRNVVSYFKSIELLPYIEYVEFKPIQKLHTLPNDYDLKLWHLDKIDAESAWNIQKGSSNIKIAIIDDAVDTEHEDLKNSIFINVNEIPGNGIDDDGNGYIDDYNGWHSTYKTGNPNPPLANQSKFTHGTHCAGISASSTNNSIGIASIGYNIKIVPIASSDFTMPGYIVSGYEGIVYAADLGVNVISLSWGGTRYSITEQTIINYTNSKGIVICASAGNSNTSVRSYPAAYNNVIAVGATDINDKKATFSNFGNWVDISAPGVNIYSSVTGFSMKYDYMSGTSMSCPLVAGLCGLMLSKNEKFTPGQIENCLKSTAENLDLKNPDYKNLLGGGRINAKRALQCVRGFFADFETLNTNICPGDKIILSNKSKGTINSYKWYLTGVDNYYSNLENPEFIISNEGIYNVKLVVSDGVLKDSMIINQLIKVEKTEVRLENTNTSIKKGHVHFLKFSFKGTAPWEFILNDGKKNMNFNDIYQNPLYLDVQPDTTTTYSIIQGRDSRCLAIVNGSAIVTVDTSTSSPGNGNGGGCGNFTLFTKQFDFGGNETPHSIYKLKSGDIIVTGLTDNGGIGGDDIFLFKFNSDGSRIWSKYYGTNANEIGYPVGIFEDNDYNLYIYGNSYTRNPSVSIVVKTDSAGNIVTFKIAENATTIDHTRFGTQLSNGNIAVVGTSAITNSQAAGYIEFNSTFTNEIRKRSFERSGIADHFLSIQEINKKLYIFGSGSTGGGGYGSMLIKQDLNGNLIWQKYIDFQKWDAGFYMSKTNVSSLMTVYWMSNTGSSTFGSSDFGISHLDTNGNRIWTKVIGRAGKDEVSGITKVKDHFYVCGTTTSFDFGISKIFVVKIDINGNVIWSKIYGSPGNVITKHTFSNNITSSESGEIYITAITRRNSKNDVLVFKIDECGNSSCFNQDVQFQEQSENITIVNGSFVDLGYLNMVNINQTSQSGQPIFNTDFCPPVTPEFKCNITADFKVEYLCLDEPVDFVSLSTASNGIKIKTYKWIFDDLSEVISNDKVQKKFPNTSASYTVKMITYADTPYSVCSDTITKVITLMPRAHVNWKLSKTTLCNNDTISCNIIKYCGRNPLQIQWLPSAIFDNSNSFSAIAKPNQSLWIKLKVSDNDGYVFLDSVFVNYQTNCCVYESEIKTNKQTYCKGDTLSFYNEKFQNGSNNHWYLYLENKEIGNYLQQDVKDIVLGEAGNYMLKLIVSGNCRQIFDSIFIGVSPLPFAFAGKDTIGCENYTYQLGSQALQYHEYEWIPMSGLNFSNISNPIADVTQGVSYKLKVKDIQSGCSNIDSVLLNYKSGLRQLPYDSVLCEGQIYFFNPIEEVNTTYEWEDGSRILRRSISKSGLYILKKTNECGDFLDSVNIDYKMCFCHLFIPNAFSPDANAINEYFPQKDIDTTINLQIYNRWGEKVFDMRSINTGWDGTYKGEKVQEGIYLYLIVYRNCYGQIVYKRGTFTLLR